MRFVIRISSHSCWRKRTIVFASDTLEVLIANAVREKRPMHESEQRLLA